MLGVEIFQLRECCCALVVGDRAVFLLQPVDQFQQSVPISVAAAPETCNFHIFVGPWTKQTPCDRARSFITNAGLNFDALPGTEVVTKIGNTEIRGWDPNTTPKQVLSVLAANGYPTTADLSKVNWVMAEIILVIMVIYVTMVYGPIAAFLVELFPTRIRYTSMSLPYHIGNGWFGGMLPLLATAIVANSGNIYAGLWYSVIFTGISVVVSLLFLKETAGRRLEEV